MLFVCYFFIFINVGLGEGVKFNVVMVILGCIGFIVILVMIGGIE